ncbi:MAG: glutamate 5-kinase, partial [Anaerolineae bacterium]|nr:glutamate 5-kinase [Anaerolineae bacterium]MCB0235358.1 glutamate 5-kinase [Anaerolineae bacterium]MCB0237531.1 glutamate 5-kinase [Anaerolineae bacterium]
MTGSPPQFIHQRIVLKLGTSVLTAGSPRINRPRLLDIVRQCARLQAAGIEVVVVSSGAIGAGRERLGFRQLPRAMPAKQMLAAVGQSRLLGLYEEYFAIYDIVVGQVLLTRA